MILQECVELKRRGRRLKKRVSKTKSLRLLRKETEGGGRNTGSLLYPLKKKKKV